MTAAAPESVCAGHETGNRARVRRYRSKHPRIDYVPSAAAAKVIADCLARGLDNCKAGCIDRLVLAGHAAMSGNGRA
jgi:hypothetical protein